MFESEKLRDWALGHIKTAESRRDWGALPRDYEATAVAQLFVAFKPHMQKSAIKQRIAAAKALTFSELRAAVMS